MIDEESRAAERDELVLCLFRRLRARCMEVTDVELRAAVVDELQRYLDTVDEDEFFADRCRWVEVDIEAHEIIEEMKQGQS